jgi:hypothetical protein
MGSHTPPPPLDGCVQLRVGPLFCEGSLRRVTRRNTDRCTSRYNTLLSIVNEYVSDVAMLTCPPFVCRGKPFQNGISYWRS